VTRRVVITGLGLATPIGLDLDAVTEALQKGRHGIHRMPEWDRIGQLRTRLAALVPEVQRSDYPRKLVRSMGRVAILGLHAAEKALADAGLGEDYVRSGQLGLAFGSTHGSSSEVEDYCSHLFKTYSFEGLEAVGFLRFMSHTCAANLAIRLGIRGRILSTCAACVSSSQAIGGGYEAIKFGMAESMLCGGAEEMHFTHAGVFDVMLATSAKYNDRPGESPRPFDAARDGLVVGEGGAAVVLESYDRAKARGATIYAEVLGYGTNCDGTSLTAPSAEGMAGAIQAALADARLAPDQIEYVNAHGTATLAGDIAESQATFKVMGDRIPVSSTKGHTGHTLGACGAMEVGFCLAMMRRGFLAPTRNLVDVDPRCAPLGHVMGEPREARLNHVMSNNFAFGGINTSLILGRL
jgi:3-oxoacyl-[acyl-carrier-protein] synthase II